MNVTPLQHFSCFHFSMLSSRRRPLTCLSKHWRPRRMSSALFYRPDWRHRMSGLHFNIHKYGRLQTHAINAGVGLWCFSVGLFIPSFILSSIHLIFTTTTTTIKGEKGKDRRIVIMLMMFIVMLSLNNNDKIIILIIIIIVFIILLLVNFSH